MNTDLLRSMLLEQLQKYAEAAEKQHGPEFSQQFEIPELLLEDFALWLQQQFESPDALQSKVQ